MESVKVELQQVKQLLADVLQLADQGESLQAESALLGSIPEFDSMAVVSVITQLEESFGLMIEDDEISADVFATVGELQAFINQKLAE